MRMVLEASFNEPEEAERLSKRLKAAGIRAEVSDERKLQKYWFLSEQLAGVHVQVEPGQFERAVQLLYKWEAADGRFSSAMHCPSCGSLRVEFPQFTRKFFSTVYCAVLCALHLFERRFYCLDCQLTWPLREKLEPRTDALGWPVKTQPVAQPKRAPTV